MKNQEFILSQQEKLIQESYNVQQENDNKKFKVIGAGKADKLQIMEFISWKQDLLNLIKNSDEKALKLRLDATKEKLSLACRKGLKTFEFPKGHPTEYKNFIICEYIMRSLN